MRDQAAAGFGFGGDGGAAMGQVGVGDQEVARFRRKNFLYMAVFFGVRVQGGEVGGVVLAVGFHPFAGAAEEEIRGAVAAGVAFQLATAGANILQGQPAGGQVQGVAVDFDVRGVLVDGLLGAVPEGGALKGLGRALEQSGEEGQGGGGGDGFAGGGADRVEVEQLGGALAEAEVGRDVAHDAIGLEGFDHQAGGGVLPDALDLGIQPGEGFGGDGGGEDDVAVADEMGELVGDGV